MASVFGIDLIRSTTELFRNARLRKKASPWDGEQTGQGRFMLPTTTLAAWWKTKSFHGC